MDQNHIPQEHPLTSPSSGNHSPQLGTNPLYEDPTLSALQKQVNRLTEMEQTISDLQAACSEVRRALTTLAPALEVHMHGLQSEADRWRQIAEDEKGRFTQAFQGLEHRMGELQQHLSAAERRLFAQHQQEVTRLKTEAEALRQALQNLRASWPHNGHHLNGEGEAYFEL